MFRCIVLGLLRSGAPRHGYALMKEYRDRSGIRIGTGSFYRELRRLLGDGLVRVATSSAGTDPRRAPYEITPAGASVFDTWLTEPASRMTRTHDDELSARVLFIAATDEPLVIKILEGWQRELWFQGKVLERARQAAVDGAERTTSGS